jgi:trigger factor
MQVSIESTGALDRRMTVQFPPERVQAEVQKRLGRLARNVRIDGFRPGKVPLKVVQQRFGPGVYQEVLGEVLEQSFHEALVQEGLYPAGGPSIEPKLVEPGQPIEYVASFQVFPEVAVADLSDVAIERPQAEITEADVDRVIESLRQQRRVYEPVQRPAENGDRMVLDFEGTVDGQPFEGGKAQGFAVEIGAGRLLPGFESQLPGLEVGAGKTIDVPFPDDYPAESLKGRTAQFALKVLSVEAPELPEVDAAFVNSFGVADGSAESLRAEVRSNMSRELTKNIRGRVKRQVMDALVARHDFELPRAPVEDETRRLREETERRLQSGGNTGSLPDSLFTEEAARRVRLGLVIRAIVRREQMTVDTGRVEAELDSLAQTYEDGDEVKQYYRANREAMAELEAMVMEEQVVDWVLAQARVTDQPQSFESLMNPGSSTTESA